MNIDYPYIILYLFLFVLVFFLRKTKLALYNQGAMLVVFLFCALRAPVVGADTWGYVRYLTGLRDFYSVNDSRALEPLFLLYREILVFVHMPIVGVMFFNSLFSLVPMFILIKKYSTNVPMSLLMFFNLGIHTLYFVALRQIFAIGVLIFALVYCLESGKQRKKKIIFFLVAVVIALGFHSTAIVYAAIFVSAMLIQVNKRSFYIVAIAISIALGMFSSSFDVLSLFAKFASAEFVMLARVAHYFDETNLNDLGTLTVVLRPSMVGFIVFLFIKDSLLNHPFSKIFAVGIIIYNLLVTVPMVQRIVLPLLMFGIIIFPWAVSDTRPLGTFAKRRLNIAIILVLLFFTRSWIIGCIDWDVYADDRLHPYYFVFEDYSNHPSINKFK